MGIFSKLFGTKDSTPAMKDYSFIADIAALITDNNSEVVSALRECASDPWAYAEKNASRYLQRGVVVSDREANDIDDICWIGMIDELEENGYLFPCDYSEEVENIIWGLSQLKNYSLIESYTDDFEADDDDDAEAFVHKLNSTLKGACICMIDIDSDSYELIIVSLDVYKKISAIAKNNGYSIITLEEVLPMAKIQMKTPLVEMDGDEMTRIIWQDIKDILLTPYIDLKTEYYDLGLVHRNETDDQVTVDSANATKKYGVAVKCATITPNAARMPEYNLKEMWKSPNGTIRAILDGTVFRTPILVKGITPYIPTWTKPITIARHAYGDVYKNVEMKCPAGSKAELVCTDKDGKETRETIYNFECDGIIQGQHNKSTSIASFARACFNFALDKKQDVWFATKDTISKKYDHTFKDIFQEIYDNEYKAKFEAAGIEYFYTLIDDAVARVIRSNGGYIWACKNYDGDVMSDMVATAYGSLAMMTSVLVSPDGIYEYEAAHGTVQRHYYKHLKGEETSTNSVATLFAWTGALRKRGELDNLPELMNFADCLEKATIQTIEDGVMTGDLYLLSTLENKKKVNTVDFLKAVDERLKKLLG